MASLLPEPFPHTLDSLSMKKTLYRKRLAASTSCEVVACPSVVAAGPTLLWSMKDVTAELAVCARNGTPLMTEQWLNDLLGGIDPCRVCRVLRVHASC